MKRPLIHGKTGCSKRVIETAVIILNWNGRNFLKNCLDSVYKQRYKNYSVIFVDNNSSDGSADFVKKNYDAIVLELDRNYGFAGGNNKGIRYALDNKFRFIVLINNDVVLDKDFLYYLVKRAKSDEKIGLVGAKMLFPNGRINSLGMWYKDGYGGNIGIGEEDKKAKKEIEIDGVCGGAFLAKSDMLNKIGLFDESLFIYYEDMDLSIRAKKAGWKIVLEPRAFLYHHHSGAFGAFSKRKLYYTERNRLILLAKHFSFFEFLKGFFLGPFFLLRNNKRRDYKTGEKVKINYFSLLPAYLSAVFSGLWRGMLIKIHPRKPESMTNKT